MARSHPQPSAPFAALFLSALSLAGLLCVGPATAQRGAPPPRPAEAPAQMLATARYLFVLRGDVLYQFEIDTLELKNQRRLPPGVDLPRAVAERDAPREPVEGRPDAERRGGRAGGRYAGSDPAAAKPARAAIDAALRWLAAHQDEDGRWDSDGFMKHDGDGERCDGAGNPVHDVGVTGLALLTFLADGNTLQAGPYSQTVRRACRWLMDQQSRDTGLIGTAEASDFIYDHAIASFALIEAYGLSDAPILRRSSQLAANYLESHRNPYAVWRYTPQGGDNDTSVTAWCASALISAKLHDLQVNPAWERAAVEWIRKMTDPETGRVGYIEPGGRSARSVNAPAERYPLDSNEAMTGAGLFMLYFLGQRPDGMPAMDKMAKLIAAKPPVWDAEDGTVDSIAWLFGARALYQRGGDAWEAWSSALESELLANQRKDGHAAGSWDAVGVWSSYGGRVFTTAALTQALQTRYRYTRLVK